MKPTDLNLAPLERDLSRFEELLDKNVQNDLQLLNNSARHLILAGGKRLRPALSIACAYGINKIEPVSQDILKGASSIELVHAGSLHHDDVIDNATSRRAVPSVNIQYSNTVAILSGDYLLALASSLAASLGVEISRLLADTIAELCVGQIIEQQDLYSAKRTKENYLKSIEGKTASLFASACKVGAIVSGGTQEQIENLNDFGFNIGMTFQIIDDLLDLTSTDEALGKPAGHDITEGVYTLPVIFAAQNDAKVRECLGDHLTKEDLEYVLATATQPQYLEPVFDLIKSYSQAAQKSLENTALNQEVKTAFESIIDGLNKRTH